MQLNIICIALIVVGVVLGFLIARAILNGNLALAEANGKSAGEIELAKLSEQIKAANQEVAQAHSRAADIERVANGLRERLEKATNERTQFEVHALRIPELEASLKDAQAAADNLNKRIAELREQNGRLETESLARQNIIEKLEQVNAKFVADLNELNDELTIFKTRNAELVQQVEYERAQSLEKLTLLEQAKQSLSDQFKSLANEILEEKSKKFAEQNMLGLGHILNPLKEKMGEFRAKVEEIHIKDAEQQATLKAELGQIKELNRQMTAEAHSLATALKGDAKKRGNWGELILGNVLERSGLREGKDYQKEVSFDVEEGRKRPDVIVYLPQGKHLVVDAKVSLNAYTRYVNAEDDQLRKQAMLEHVAAVASRIKELSDRNYFDMPGINSPEMVFMFIPIESAFVEALRADEDLFQKAIEQNVLVATPTTLLTSLNIVRQLWRFEEQNANAAALAESAAAVYKKLAGFLASMTEVGDKLDKAKESFNKAMGQLYSGKGNLIQKAKNFEQLGVSVRAALPEALVTKAALELEHNPEAAASLEQPADES